jgi:hypothetical protein
VTPDQQLQTLREIMHGIVSLCTAALRVIDAVPVAPATPVSRPEDLGEFFGHGRATDQE